MLIILFLLLLFSFLFFRLINDFLIKLKYEQLFTKYYPSDEHFDYIKIHLSNIIDVSKDKGNFSIKTIDGQYNFKNVHNDFFDELNAKMISI